MGELFAGERNIVQGVDAEIRTAAEEGILYGNFRNGGEHHLGTGCIGLLQFGSDLCGFELFVGLLDGLRVGNGNGVIVGANLHHDVHFAGFVEHLEGVYAGAETAVDALEGHLQGTDVLKTLDSNI